MNYKYIKTDYQNIEFNIYYKYYIETVQIVIVYKYLDNNTHNSPRVIT